ncbi:MAG: VOC family protein [Opitutus sp.]
MSPTSTLPTRANSARVDPIPQGTHTVTPHLVCAGAAEAIEFYKRAFGATELSRVVAQNGKLMHASVRIGDSVVMLADEFPEWRSVGPKALNGTSVTIHLYVHDADAQAEQAVNAGAKLIMPVQEMFWGDRYGALEDPFGHRWAVATHVRDVTPEEAQKASRAMCG